MPLTSATLPPRAPYSLEPIAFPFPVLATLAGRAPMGGPRETALGCFLVARLVASELETRFSQEQMEGRVAGTRHWIGAAAIPAPVRSALLALLDTLARHDRAALAGALDSVMTVTANQLDAAARLELGRLAQAVAG